MTSKRERELTLWRNRLTTMGHNLTALSDAEPTHAVKSRLVDTLHPLTGVTRDRVEQTLQSLGYLWDVYLAVARVIEDAEGLVRKNSFLRNTESDLDALLDGLSVSLPPCGIPLMARALLEGPESFEAVTLTQAVDAMQAEFAKARSTLLQVTQASEHSAGRLAALVTEAQNLDQRASLIGGVELLALSQKALESRLNVDPLACAEQLDRFEELVDRRRGELDRLEQDSLAVLLALRHAQECQRALADLVERSRAAVEDCRRCIADPAGLVEPAGAQSLSNLGEWLKTLGRCHDQGQWQSVKVGIGRWQSECDRRATQETRAYAINRALLDEKTALRGKLRALQAKAGSLAACRPSADDRLAALLERAQVVLHARPLNLTQGRRLIAACETMLFSQ